MLKIIKYVWKRVKLRIKAMRIEMELNGWKNK